MKMRWPFERFDKAVCKASLKMAISRGNPSHTCSKQQDHIIPVLRFTNSQKQCQVVKEQSAADRSTPKKSRSIAVLSLQVTGSFARVNHCEMIVAARMCTNRLQNSIRLQRREIAGFLRYAILVPHIKGAVKEN